jgi:hypothetical protein
MASNNRFERDAPTAGFAARFRAPQTARWASQQGAADVR